MKIHVLLEGLPLCRFTYDVPTSWNPDTDRWVTIESPYDQDILKVNCSDCAAKLLADMRRDG